MWGKAWIALLTCVFSVDLLLILECKLRVEIVDFSGDVEALFYQLRKGGSGFLHLRYDVLN